MLCEGAGYWTEGDTGYIGMEMIGGNIWGKSTTIRISRIQTRMIDWPFRFHRHR